MFNTPTLYLSVCHTFHGYRVCTGPGKPEKSWDVILTLSRTGWKKATGPGKFWKYVKLN